MDVLVDPIDLGSGVREFFEGRGSGEFGGLFDGEGVVEEVECLLGDDCLDATGGVVVGMGDVEVEEDAGESVAVEEGVKAAAVV